MSRLVGPKLSPAALQPLPNCRLSEQWVNFTREELRAAGHSGEMANTIWEQLMLDDVLESAALGTAVFKHEARGGVEKCGKGQIA